MKPSIVGLAALLTLASADQLRAQGGPDGQLPPGCSWVKDTPSKPPRPAEARKDSLRDSIRTSLSRDLRTAARGAGIAQPRGVVVVSLDRRRTEPKVRLSRSNVPDSVAAAAVAHALPGLQRWPDSGPVRLFARLDSLPDLAATIGTPKWECPPVLLDRGALTSQIQEFIARQAMLTRSPGRPLTARLQMVVTKEGVVASADLSRTSGMIAFDQLVLQSAPTFRFKPALLNGFPVDILVTLPINVEIPGGPGRP